MNWVRKLFASVFSARSAPSAGQSSGEYPTETSMHGQPDAPFMKPAQAPTLGEHVLANLRAEAARLKRNKKKHSHVLDKIAALEAGS